MVTTHSSTLLFQNLIAQAAFNPDILPLGSASCEDGSPCHVFWGGGNRTKPYASVVLIASGLTFLGQSILFLAIGSLADFGNWNRWIVRIFCVLCWGFEFGFLGLKTASVWRAAMALYILSSKFASYPGQFEHVLKIYALNLVQYGLSLSCLVLTSPDRYNVVGILRLFQRCLPQACTRPPGSASSQGERARRENHPGAVCSNCFDTAIAHHEHELPLEQHWLRCLLRTLSGCAFRTSCGRLGGKQQLGLLGVSRSLHRLLDHLCNTLVLVGEETTWPTLA